MVMMTKASGKRTVPASDKMEAFYADSLLSIAKIAREKYGDEPKTIHIIAALSRAVGMCICACRPEERAMAYEVAGENLKYAVQQFGDNAVENPMEKK